MVTAVSPKSLSPIQSNAGAQPTANLAGPGQPAMKDTMAGKPQALGQSLKDTFGPVPGQDKKSEGGGSKDPQLQIWMEKYQDALKRAEEAKDPAAKAHAEAEAKQIKLTIDAMEGKAPVGGKEGAPAPDAKEPGAPAHGGAGGGKSIEQFMPALQAASEKTGVPAEILGGMLWQESRGKLDASSTNGGNGLTDTGLMQINPNTYSELQQKHPELQGKDLSDPETNILAAGYFMADLKDKFGSWELALRAYNSGENGVDPGNPNATPAGTGDPTYIPKVMEFADIISQGGELPA